jgi:hypothetical protein
MAGATMWLIKRSGRCFVFDTRDGARAYSSGGEAAIIKLIDENETRNGLEQECVLLQLGM